MFGLNLTQLFVGSALGAACVVSLLLIGDNYGPHARRLANLEALGKAKNEAITYQNTHENQVGLEEDKRFASEDKEFKSIAPTLGQCVLTADQVKALNSIGD